MLEEWEIEENVNIPEPEPEPVVAAAPAPEPQSPIEIQKPKQRKTWKHVNASKTPVTGEKLVKLMYTHGMRELWTKKYKLQLPTWHAVGTKWQGMLNNLIRDIYKQMPRHKDVGDYKCCAYEEGLEKPIMSVYRTNIQRYPAHLKQVVSSLVNDI